MNDEKLAEQSLKEQADMLNKAFGLEKPKEYEIPDYDEEEIKVSNDIMWWRDRIARGLGVEPEELEVTHNPLDSIDSSSALTVIEPRRVLLREDVEKMYEGIVSQPIGPYNRGQSHLASAAADFVKWHMNKPSLSSLILPPAEEDK